MQLCELHCTLRDHNHKTDPRKNNNNNNKKQFHGHSAETHGAGVEDGGPIGWHPEGDDEQEVHQVSQEERNHHKQQEASHHTLQALHREGGIQELATSGDLACSVGP